MALYLGCIRSINQRLWMDSWINGSIFRMYLVHKPEALDGQLDKWFYI
ncbi:unnamed protein product [Staurois parvus]|uniref:Ycf15 n=1 Tax=Staurois parvus TaxID=386267 RepID=A0ABN9BVH6_9NEOB|nr:unnamed protein product [Staurois parvus]